MAAYKLSDDYAAAYPALLNSILSLLVFSDHTLAGTAFTGTLDVAASGAALETLGTLTGLAAIAVSGTVTNDGTTLTVTLRSTDDAAFASAIGAKIPLIGNDVTKDAWMTVDTVAATSDPPDLPPATDEIDLSLTLAVGSASVTIVSRVPMAGGFFVLTGTFSGVEITLDDLGFLLGSDSSSWFPASDLGAFYTAGTALALLSLSLTVHIALTPFAVSLSSVSTSIGIVDIPLLPPKIYLNPLAVTVTVTDPTGSPESSYGLEGSAVLCNFADPGDPAKPDFTFDIALGLAGAAPHRTFAVSGQFENPDNLPISTMLKDLIDPSTDIGISPTLTITTFDFAADVVQATGALTDFSADVAMSGGFGLFTTFDLESISISVAYSA